ncbi:MAG: DNA replication and repair protein RecF, partial [Chthoniobacterales bacterium]|nr:DNA replication and repair protein RecF [Chthoniobacterales bacterium]
MGNDAALDMGDKREGESFRVFCYGGAKRFEVRRLGIRSFRCYREGEFEFGAGLNLVVGRNGVGKTSLLEAVCMVLRLQSPRSAKPGPCVAWGERNFCLEGDFVEIGEGGWERGVRLAVENGEDGRRLWIDGDCVRDSDRYLSLGRVVWFSGEDRELVRGSGTMRRRYLDFLCLQLFPGYLKVLRDYERALRSRNYLLRMGARRAEVEAFDEPLAGLGKRLQECRQWVMPKVKERADEVVRWLTDGVENVEVNYLPSGGSELLKRLRENYEEDQLLRMTTLGPHRDDFAVLINGRSAGDYAS